MVTPRDRNRARTTVEIVDAAEQIVASDGLDALTIGAVATRVGLTNGALYRYFDSREAILAQVEARVIADLGRASSDAASRHTDPLDRIVAATGALVAFSLAEPARYAVLSRMMAIPHALVEGQAAANIVPIAIGSLLPLQLALVAAREAGQLSGSAADDNPRVLVLWSAMHGAVQLHKLARYAPGAHAAVLGRSSLHALLLGFGSAPEAAAHALRLFPEQP
jgi:AcrR family transcriptional regulator